jgi:ABC-type antimicrobial peptide transport system permease subunit
MLVAIGVAIGAAFSWWASKFASTLLFGLEPRDLPTFIGAAAALGAIGALAAWLPARRASRLNPAQVLKES